MGAPRIQDYALLGDGRSAALVSRDGSIDWLCWPRFDSGAVFAALLDEPRGGAFRVRPTAYERTSRRYVDDTNVLETRFTSRAGELVLTDLMPVASEADKRRMLTAEHELLRVARCVRGEVELAVDWDPRPDFGRARVRLRDCGCLGVHADLGSQAMSLRSEVPLRLAGAGAWARVRLKAGESVAFSMTFSTEGPAVFPPLGDAVRERVERSLSWWRQWTRRVRYEGPYRAEVVRSALALKLLLYAPSGAIVAAPTTSLPERIGGSLNWDYRFCWLRDAALTVRALYGLGFVEQAHAFVDWLLHSTRLTRPELRVLYDVFGNVVEHESELGLEGYRGSSPVRLGNAAGGQLQLDVYGEVIDAAAQLVRHEGRLDKETRSMLEDFGEWVCRHWEQPDHGIWEPREEPRHHTHSRALCWVALERLIELHRLGVCQQVEVDRYARDAARIRADIERHGWNDSLGSYVQSYGGGLVDASLLLLSWYGFEDARSPRMRGTFRRIVERLGAGDGLLYRYEQSRADGEGAFGICSFWAAEYLARGGGTLREATRWFDGLLSCANDVGLYAEEVDPATGHALGNFPQAFTHVGLVNAALSLEERAKDERGRGGAKGRVVESGAEVRP